MKETQIILNFLWQLALCSYIGIFYKVNNTLKLYIFVLDGNNCAYASEILRI